MLIFLTLLTLLITAYLIGTFAADVVIAYRQRKQDAKDYREAVLDCKLRF